VPVCSHCSAPYIDASAKFCGQCGGSLVGGGAAPDGSGPAVSADAWLERVLDGRYRVLSRLGSGGMGVVYRVQHLQLGKIAAMKVLHPNTASDSEMIRRFRMEAQSISRLNHPNIVQTFDFGQWDGALYLVMEYVKGEDLAAVLTREGPMSFTRAAKFFVQVCSALTEAHDTGIIHRDLKPENLMLITRRDGSEHAKVLDFGLAKLRERDDSAGITSGGQVVGTPYYMSPEQVRGEVLDVRADVYSLGATLYRVLTGFPPFQASSPMGVLTKHLTEDVVPPRARAPDRQLPAQADRIVLRAMARSAEDRYASAADMQRDLEHALAHPQEDSRRRALAVDDGELPLSTAEAPTVALDEVDVAEEGQRLRRRDFDDFERSLRRRKRITRIAVPLAALALVAGGGALVVRATSEKATTAEHEPNNTPGYANLLPQNARVLGTIGPLIEGGHPDVDYYRIPPGHGPRVASARLEGIPSIDLVLELFDSQGRRIAKADVFGRGSGEDLRATTIGPAEAYLLVREFWVEGGPPRAQNVPTPYSLTATWGPPDKGWEVEPNDWLAAATPLETGQVVQAYIADVDDKDWFIVTPASDGHLIGTVTAPEGVDIVLAFDEAGKKTSNHGGPGEDEDFSVPCEAGKPITIEVTRKTPHRKDPKDKPLAGWDKPYELRTELRR
jgi:serine/threonine protein kinase